MQPPRPTSATSTTLKRRLRSRVSPMILFLKLSRTSKISKPCVSDGIPNKFYERTAAILLLFIVLKNSKYLNYSFPGSYRSITFLNCLSKILSSCVVKILVHENERPSLISNSPYVSRQAVRPQIHTPHDMLYQRRMAKRQCRFSSTSRYQSCFPQCNSWGPL